VFKAKPYTRACVAVTDDNAPGEVHYLFASGLLGYVHVISETNRSDEVTVVHEHCPTDRVSGLFGVRVYEEVRKNLGQEPRLLPRQVQPHVPKANPLSRAMEGALPKVKP
jgi:hypothetical protein